MEPEIGRAWTAGKAVAWPAQTILQGSGRPSGTRARRGQAWDRCHYSKGGGLPGLADPRMRPLLGLITGLVLARCGGRESESVLERPGRAPLQLPGTQATVA